MKNNTSRLVLIAALIAGAAPLFTSCASEMAMRAALSDRDAELRRLRDERVQLKERIQLLLREQEGLEITMRDASFQTPEVIEVIEVIDDGPMFPELSELGIGVGQRDGHVVITLPSAITFQSGKAELTQEGKRGLGAVASRLRGGYGGSSYHIEGHTDSDPIRKSKFASNRDLSLSRAMAVLDHLVGECQILDDDCVVAGYGQYVPLAPNSSEANKAKNRRVEIVVHARK
jgi:chemotaxis protein MotB